MCAKGGRIKMRCERCGSDTRMQVQATISAPGELAHKFSKSNLRRKDVYLMGVLWETADFICTNPNCGTVKDGYGNYVSNLKKEVDRLHATLAQIRELDKKAYDNWRKRETKLLEEIENLTLKHASEHKKREEAENTLAVTIEYLRLWADRCYIPDMSREDISYWESLVSGSVNLTLKRKE